MLKAIKKLFGKNRAVKYKKISVYGIFSEKPELNPDGTFKDKNIIPVSFAKDLEQAAVIIDRLLYYKYFSHFSSWIKCSKESDAPPSQESELWGEYKATVIYNSIAESLDYNVLKLTYTSDDFAAILRMFSSCNPVYLPHEGTNELLEYMKRSTADDGRVMLPAEVTRVLHDDPTIGSQVQQMYKRAGASVLLKEE